MFCDSLNDQADEVADFARELRLILRYLGVSDANMEKGQMRIEANVSLNMGTYTELKNINSFKAVHDAVEYELWQQEDAMKKGEKLVKETRRWNEAQQKTVSQRSQEEAHDYRYFPEPDLPLFETKEFEIDRLRDELPKLPEAKRKRFKDEYGLSDKQLELVIAEPAVHDYKKGKTASLQFLIGKAMAKLKGRAKPDMFMDLLKRMLGTE